MVGLVVVAVGVPEWLTVCTNSTRDFSHVRCRNSIENGLSTGIMASGRVSVTCPCVGVDLVGLPCSYFLSGFCTKPSLDRQKGLAGQALLIYKRVSPRLESRTSYAMVALAMVRIDHLVPPLRNHRPDSAPAALKPQEVQPSSAIYQRHPVRLPWAPSHPLSSPLPSGQGRWLC